MVLRRAASTAAYLLIHRASCFVPPCGRYPPHTSIFRRQSTSQTRRPSAWLRWHEEPKLVRPQQRQQLNVRSKRGFSMAAGEGSTAGAATTVFAFDFDGVICNSQGESSRSGFKAVENIWPKIVAQLRDVHGGREGDETPAWIVDKMKQLRPIVETGYENILLVRLLIEERLGLPTPYPSEELFERWGSSARDELASRYGMSREELVDAFGRARDDWIETDFQGWLSANTFYEGVPEAISACTGEVYVVTTKQTRFASALLKYAGVQVPLDRIFGLGTGPKAGVLAELLEKHSGSTIVFLEDRVETLEAVCADSKLVDVKLYLCDWGFNTAAQRARGESNERITVIGTQDIVGLLTHGN